MTGHFSELKRQLLESQTECNVLRRELDSKEVLAISMQEEMKDQIHKVCLPASQALLLLSIFLHDPNCCCMCSLMSPQKAHLHRRYLTGCNRNSGVQALRMICTD
jgi:hypothetical protein